MAAIPKKQLTQESLKANIQLMDEYIQKLEKEFGKVFNENELENVLKSHPNYSDILFKIYIQYRAQRANLPIDFFENQLEFLLQFEYNQRRNAQILRAQKTDHSEQQKIQQKEEQLRKTQSISFSASQNIGSDLKSNLEEQCVAEQRAKDMQRAFDEKRFDDASNLAHLILNSQVPPAEAVFYNDNEGPSKELARLLLKLIEQERVKSMNLALKLIELERVESMHLAHEENRFNDAINLAHLILSTPEFPGQAIFSDGRDALGKEAAKITLQLIKNKVEGLEGKAKMIINLEIIIENRKSCIESLEDLFKRNENCLKNWESEDEVLKKSLPSKHDELSEGMKQLSLKYDELSEGMKQLSLKQASMTTEISNLNIIITQSQQEIQRLLSEHPNIINIVNQLKQKPKDSGAKESNADQKRVEEARASGEEANDQSAAFTPLQQLTADKSTEATRATNANDSGAAKNSTLDTKKN